MTQARTMYQVDAFTDKIFGGNPAAVLPLDTWPDDTVLLNIAMENNLSETAFFVPNDAGYHLRWLTPGGEVDLCGHATLASAFILFEELGHEGEIITFESASGPLYVHKKSAGYMLDFPVWKREKIETPPGVAAAIGIEPLEYYKGPDDVAVLPSPADVRNLAPDFGLLAKCETARGVLATAQGDIDGDYDFISRAFFPRLSVNEDPVTGSAHCILAPYWGERLGKTTLKAHQASARGGDLLCRLNGDRVEITGQAALYMRGEIYV